MTDRKEYLKQYRLSHKENYREYNKKYRETHLTTYDKLKQENEKLKEENSRLKHLPKQIEQYILKEMYVNREVVAGWLQFDKLLKMIDRGMNNE